MKLEDLRLDQCGEKEEWVKSCIFNKWTKEGEKAFELLEASNNSCDFLDRFVNCNELMNSQGFAEYAKCNEQAFGKALVLHKMFADEALECCADAGSVRLSCGQMQINVTNGRGDGDCVVFVYHKDGGAKKFNSDLFYHIPVWVNGTFSVMEYDCEDPDQGNIVCALNGRYEIYVHNGYVFLVES